MTQSGNTAIYNADSVLFRHGDSAADAYVIIRGMVEISTNQMGKKLVFANLGPGEVLGELALISQQPRTATALAVEETEVLVITRKHLQELIDSADPLLTSLMQGYLGRFMWTQRFMLHNSSGHLHAGGQSLQKQADQDLALEKEIDQAIQNRNFELFYQPVVSLRSGRIAGFEALMRWRHPSRGLVSPVEFIGLAEKTGQIVDMGYWALEQALSDLRKFQTASDRARTEEKGEGEGQNNGELFMSVNVSGRQLLELEEIERLGQLLANSGVAPERVKLEITESLLVDDPAHAAVALGKLREKGVRLAIDDFGTGYSSLSYLHLFPLDTLKIDHSFVSNMLKDERRFRIVRAISRLARDLDLDVIAEGIETPQELEKLRELECDYIQGFLFAKPLPFGEVQTLLAGHPFYS